MDRDYAGGACGADATRPRQHFSYTWTMCTAGALRLGASEFLLFKNKDFGRSSFDDRLVVEPDVFGVEGITTWAGKDPDLDEFSGFSIGANAHGLLVCDSNVRTLPDHENYDCLVEIALREGRDVWSGVDTVRDATTDRPYLWANLVLIDQASIVAIDVRGQHIEITEGSDRIARSNHHVVLGPHELDDDSVTSPKRLASAVAHLGGATSIADIFGLQASHDHGDTGVCNHSLYDTVYSYVLQRVGDATNLFVTKGHPCQATQRHQLRLPLGADWTAKAAEDFRAGYPSARAQVTTISPD